MKNMKAASGKSRRKWPNPEGQDVLSLPNAQNKKKKKVTNHKVFFRSICLADIARHFFAW
jgi:hypothetical protein